MLSRRKFLQQGMYSAGALAAAPLLPGILNADTSVSKLTILHTNDVHSRLEPFPMDGSRNQGLGGVAARAEIINDIRAKEENVLLLDAGDIFQGTPYFNIYKGEPEIKAMAAMRYDAGTIGNHDFDGGIDNLAAQLQHANFPLLICNYDFAGTSMEYKYAPYKVYKKGNLKIGIFGVGIELKGLVPESLSGETKYLEPVEHANETAYQLKRKKNCDFIICLSHLGYKYNDNKISDERFAADSENIDLIIGGHTHTFLNEPVVIKNKKNSDVIVNQVGWAGIILGRLDFEFSKINGKKLTNSNSVSIRKKTTE